MPDSFPTLRTGGITSGDFEERRDHEPIYAFPLIRTAHRLDLLDVVTCAFIGELAIFSMLRLPF